MLRLEIKHLPSAEGTQSRSGEKRSHSSLSFLGRGFLAAFTGFSFEKQADFSLNSGHIYDDGKGRRRMAWNSPDSWARLREVRNKLKATTRSARETFMRTAFSSSKPKELWRVIHRILKPSQHPIRIDPGKLNEFFASTAERTLPTKADSPESLEQWINNLPAANRPYFQLKEVTRTHSKPSTGPDKIPVRFVKPVMDIIAGPLTAIINNCNWKLETGPNQSHPKNWPTEAHFRPISVLPAMSKVFEKLVAVQIGNLCEREATLKHAISEFRKGHSTCTVLMGIRDDLLRAMKKGEVTLMVLADFSKAIRYETLITKLSTHGFSRSFLRWLTNYLSQRSHFVQIDDRKWTWLTCSLAYRKDPCWDQCYSIYMLLTCKIICPVLRPLFNMQMIQRFTRVFVLVISVKLPRDWTPPYKNWFLGPRLHSLRSIQPKRKPCCFPQVKWLASTPSTKTDNCGR